MDEKWTSMKIRTLQEDRDKLATHGPVSIVKASPLSPIEYDTAFGEAGKAIFNIPDRTLSWASCITPTGKESKYLVSVYETARAPHDTPKYAAIVRITAQGEIDTSFGSTGDGYAQVRFEALNYTMPDFIHEMSDGRLIVSGRVIRITNETFQTVPMITRLKAGGTPDSSFASNGILDVSKLLGKEINNLVTRVLPNGKLLLLALDTSGSAPHSYLVRLTETGSLDASFQGKGYVEIAQFDEPTYVTKSALINDAGEIVLSGAVGNTSFMTRRDENGNTESQFGSSGAVTFPPSSFSSYDCSSVFNNASLLVCGSSKNEAMLAHYKATGAVEVKFNKGEPTYTHFGKEFASSLWTTATIQPGSGGKIVTIGTGSVDATTSWSVMGRHLGTGELDTSFGAGAGLGSPTDATFFPSSTGFITTDDGRALCAGEFQGSAAILAIKL